MSIFSRLRDDIQGNVGVMFSVVAFAAIAAVGAAVDYSRLEKSHQKLQGISDSLALAGAAAEDQSRENLDTLLNQLLEAHNHPYAKMNYSIGSDGITVTVTEPVDMAFMGIFGDATRNPAAAATAPMMGSDNGQDLNVAFVLDATHSMAGSKMRALRAAATNALAELENRQGNVYASLVPFVEVVKIPTSYEGEAWLEVQPAITRDIRILDQDASTNCNTTFVNERREIICDEYVYRFQNTTYSWGGCMGSRLDGYNEEANFMSRRLQGFVQAAYCTNERNVISPLTNNFAALKTGVQNISAFGETYLPAGLNWGWRTLSPEEPLIEARQNAGADNIMIVMTDGETNRSLGGTHPRYNGIRHDGNDAQESDALSRRLCEKIKADGIEIYTIAFEVDDAETKTLLTSCASSLGHFYDAGNADALDLAFTQILQQSDEVRLSR